MAIIIFPPVKEIINILYKDLRNLNAGEYGKAEHQTSYKYFIKSKAFNAIVQNRRN
jgi:hypothetical protein